MTRRRLESAVASLLGLGLVLFVWSTLGADEPSNRRPAVRDSSNASEEPVGAPPRATESSQPKADVAAVAEATAFRKHVAPFLKTYCVRCHGAKVQKGDRRFDPLDGVIRDDESLVDYQDVLDQLNLGEMPPDSARQPRDEERRAVVRWLTARIAGYHAARREDAATVLRRMNAREYRNTIRDLLRLDTTIFDPTSEFPRDRTSEHLDNDAESLVTSGHLLGKYLAAAETSIEKALFPLERPEPRKWAFRDGFRQQPEIDQVHRTSNRFERMTLYDVPGADKPEGAYGPILAFKQGVPLDGVYEIRLRAEAVNREHPYDRDFVGTDPAEPLRLGIVPGNQRVGLLHKTQPVEPLLAEIELADEAKWYTVRVQLDRGYTPRFTFPNGLMDVRNLWGKLVRKYPDQFPEADRPGIVSDRRRAITHGKLPQIHIHEIEINGPLIDEWPTPSQRALLGADAAAILESGTMAAEQIRRGLRGFAGRAFRRPPTDDEIGRLEALVAQRRAAGRAPIEAYADGLKAILCSPNFLYLPAIDADGPTDEGLAARLSYFLWSSTPDAKLLELAAAGRLRDPNVLAGQVERLLRDERSNAFVEGFLESWLTLRDLGSMPPDRGRFRAYYRGDLRRAMLEETRRFTRHLLDENLDIGLFLDADFTFANRPLARHYGIPLPDGPGFAKVSLAGDRRRGGLLGQASVLTVTANGIDTSPVVRGVWLLENLLGTPPSPPPPDVEPLDPDSRGAKTIREQLRKHRQVATCNECHRKIDPLGFALENFDPIGRWRENYDRRLAVDASGELPGGETFGDVRDFKRLLVKKQLQFARALSTKLMAYAVGRGITAADRPDVDRLLRQHAEAGSGLRDLVKAVAVSETFRSP